MGATLLKAYGIAARAARAAIRSGFPGFNRGIPASPARPGLPGSRVCRRVGGRSARSGGERAMDPYETLGVAPGAPSRDVRRAFRAAALRWHPDRPGGDAAKFRAARQAYEMLSDSARRAANDQAARPRLVLSPAAIDLGTLAIGRKMTRTIFATNAGRGQPELSIDRDRGPYWRVASIAGSTAPGGRVEIVIEFNALAARPTKVQDELTIRMGAQAAQLPIRFVVTEPEPGHSSGDLAGGAARDGASHAAGDGRRSIPGWDGIGRQPRWRLISAAVLAGLVLPALVLSGQHGPASGAAVASCVALAIAALVVSARTEAFSRERLEFIGTGEQAAVAAVVGDGAATAALLLVVVAIAVVVAVLVLGAIAAALSDG